MTRSFTHNALALLIALLATACGIIEVGIQDHGAASTEAPALTSVSERPDATGTAAGAGLAVAPTAPPGTPWPTAQPAGVTAIAVTPDGAVWYGFGHFSCCPPQGSGGVRRRLGEETTQLGLVDGLPDENVQVLKVAPDGALWAGAASHVVRFDGQTWRPIVQVATHITSIVLDIAFTPDGVAWIASPFELVRFDGQTCTVYDAMVRELAVGPSGEVWASGWQGLQDSAFVGSFDGMQWTTHNTIELFREAVGHVAVTPDGRVWGSTGRHGVVCLGENGWKEYTTADGLPSNRIVELAVAPDGVLWAVTDFGVAYFAGHDWVSLDDSPRWIKVMAFAPDGTIWFGTSTGEVAPYVPAIESEPSATPSSVTKAKDAAILSFKVAPTETKPGEAVTLTWAAHGDRAMVCPSARFILFTEDDCWQVPLSGVATYTIPVGAEGFPSVDFVLTVEIEGSPTRAVGYASARFKCDRKWFFSDDPQAGICPLEPIVSFAVAQQFERGTILWLEKLGRYFVLEEALVDGAAPRKRVDYIDDPLEIVQDTSAEVETPEGLHAPLSGFGLVWRGDVSNSPGFREKLGWALAREFAYEAVFQCDDARPSGGRSWQTCHLEDPDGRVIVFHPLGGWYLLGE